MTLRHYGYVTMAVASPCNAVFLWRACNYAFIPRLATANLIRPGIHGDRAKLRREEMARKVKFERGGCNADRIGGTQFKWIGLCYPTPPPFLSSRFRVQIGPDILTRLSTICPCLASNFGRSDLRRDFKTFKGRCSNKTKGEKAMRERWRKRVKD